MGISIQKISITDLQTDAVVNAANAQLEAGGGVCGAIFQAAGYSELRTACRAIGSCPTGQAVITPGFHLKARYIIHAVGPVWHGGNRGEPQLLCSAYRQSLRLAQENGCRSIGFPLISAGIYGYPQELAWQQALQACRDFLQEQGDILDIIFAVLNDRILRTGESLLNQNM